MLRSNADAWAIVELSSPRVAFDGARAGLRSFRVRSPASGPGEGTAFIRGCRYFKNTTVVMVVPPKCSER